MEINEKLKLAMRAGAYAIRNNSSLQNGCFIGMPWIEAEKILICTAEGLDPDEWEIKHE